MKKNKYALFVIFAALISALAFVFAACDLGYANAAIVDAVAPKIIKQPVSTGVNVGETKELTVEAALEDGSPGTLEYQWYRYLTYRAYEDQAGIVITGATGASFTIPTESDGEFNYYVVVTNNHKKASGRKMSSVKSNAVTVTVNDPKNARYPVITTQPTGATLTYSPRMVLPALEIAASVEPAALSDEIRYQWYVSDKLVNTNGTVIAGATAPRLIPPVVLPGQEPKEGWINGAGDYYYFCVVTNFYFNVPGRRESAVASNPVLLKIEQSPNADAPVITVQPQNAIYFSGDTVRAITVSANEPEDGGTLSYQWYSNDKSSNSGGTAIDGQTADTFTPAINTTTRARYYYYVVVTNNNPYVTNPTTSTISRVSEINVTTPVNKSANATFTVQFGGTNQYQFVRGFGGMDVAWGNFPNYNHPSLPAPSNIADDYETMYNPENLGYNMLRIMILPHNVDINKTMDDLVNDRLYTNMKRSRYYENVKTVNRYGGYVLASPWSPPAAWKTNNSINGGGGLRPSDYQNYANYLRAYAQNMLNNGAPVYAISIQNEPNYAAGYDGCEWTGDEMRDFFKKVGRFTEGVAGFGGGKVIESVKTMNGESANTTTINASAMGEAGAKVNIDLLARHNYGSRSDNGAGISNAVQNWIYSTSATGPREIWMTEHNLNSNSAPVYPNDHTWNYVWLFMNDVDMTVRINHEAAFIWWSSKRFYSMLGDGTYNAEDSGIMPRGWGLAHYAKFAKESYRVGVAATGKTKDGTDLADGTNVNGSRTEDFTSTTVKVSAFMKLKGGEIYPVNWRNKNVPIADIEEITMVMFTPTTANLEGSGGYDMGTVKLQMPAGFKISSATAMRSDKDIFHSSGNNRGTPVWETVDITADRNAAFVELPRSTILSVRFTQ